MKLESLINADTHDHVCHQAAQRLRRVRGTISDTSPRLAGSDDPQRDGTESPTSCEVIRSINVSARTPMALHGSQEMWRNTVAASARIPSLNGNGSSIRADRSGEYPPEQQEFGFAKADDRYRAPCLRLMATAAARPDLVAEPECVKGGMCLTRRRCSPGTLT